VQEHHGKRLSHPKPLEGRARRSVEHSVVHRRLRWYATPHRSHGPELRLELGDVAGKTAVPCRKACRLHDGEGGGGNRDAGPDQ
jgi:hypothetical protein